MEYKNIIEKCKELLNISSDMPLRELYNKLWDLRNTYHPDRFLNDDLKIKAEVSFKEIGTLLSDLHKLIEIENLGNKNSTLIPYEDEFETIKLKQENLNNDNQINDLKKENKNLRIDIETLECRINEMLSKKAKEKEVELMSKYCNSKKNVISVGIILTLIAIISILTKIDEVTKIIFVYSPIDKKIINIIVFAIFILIIIISIKKYLEKKYINKLSNIIQTSIFIKKFFIRLNTETNKDYFSEFDVTAFIMKELLPKNKIKRKIINFTNILSASTLDALKDIFIYHLYERSLIEFQDAHCLDRFFRIKKSYRKDIQDKSNVVNELLHNVIW